MEPTDVGVSLDELTLDLSEAFNVEDDTFPNEIGLSVNNVDGHVANNKDKSELYKTDIHVSDQKVNSDGDQSTGIHDFECDIPPLSLFPSFKETASDESDSEFEVPDVVQSATPITATSQNEHLHVDLHENVGTNFGVQNQDVGVSLQPQILTPQDPKTTDLSVAQEGSSDAPSSYILANNESESNSPDISTQQMDVSKHSQPESSSPTRNISNDNLHSQIQIPPPPIEFSDEATDVQRPEIVTTAEDWEGVQVVEAGYVKPGEKTDGSSAGYQSKPLQTFTDSWREFESQDYSTVKGDIKPRLERKGFSAFTHMLFGPPKLHNDLIMQRDLIFCIAATSFNNDSSEHNQVLQTVYRCLTGSKFDCSRYGNHWEEIGFQGRDPATDLRGAGMLALLHLLFFLRDPSTKELARDVYKLSLHPTQNFPFCIMGINLTRICIQVLREETYNRECNRRKDVVGTLNSVYAALFLKFYTLWKPGKTIADSGFILKEVENHGKKHAKTIFKDLEMYEKKRKQQGPFGETVDAEPNFFTVCNDDQSDTKSAAELY